MKFLEVAFGKVPDRVVVDELQPNTTLILKYAHEMPGYVPPNEGVIIALDGCFLEASRTALQMAKPGSRKKLLGHDREVEAVSEFSMAKKNTSKSR
jgi:hypothetical protein